MSQSSTEEHYVAPHSGEVNFDELHDAAPSAKFRLSVGGWIGTVIVVFWLFVAVFGQVLAPYGEDDNPFPDDYSQWQAPREGAVLGTDYLDRDVLSRIMYGAGRTIGISVIATVIAYAFGVILGIGAAISSPKIDMMMSRTNDVLISIPTIMLGLVAVTVFGSEIPVLITICGLIFASIVFRIARGIGMDIKVMDYVEAAKVRGEGMWWIVSKEIWPNAAMPMISDFGLRLIYVILLVSSLSFLGLGVQPPQADWGSMVAENRGALANIDASVWPVLAPALAIASLTVGINLVVDDISAHAGGKLSKAM